MPRNPAKYHADSQDQQINTLTLTELLALAEQKWTDSSSKKPPKTVQVFLDPADMKEYRLDLAGFRTDDWFQPDEFKRMWDSKTTSGERNELVRYYVLQHWRIRILERLLAHYGCDIDPQHDLEIVEENADL